MKAETSLLGLAMCLLLPSLPGAPAGAAFTYQGRLADGGTAPTGLYDLQFGLFNVANGGAPLAGPLTVEDTAVTNGLFTVQLDFGASVFTGEARWLEIGVRPGASVGTFTPLSPRQSLAPTPYATFASTDGGVSSGAITSNMLANNAVTSAKLATGAVTSVALADAINLGSTDLAGRLDVFRTAAGTAAISLIGAVSQLRIYGGDGAEKTRLDASPGWGQLQLNNGSTVSQRAAILTANAVGGGSLTLYNSNGLQRALLFGANAGGEIDLNDALGTKTVSLLGSSSQISTYGSDGLEQIRLWGPLYGEVLLFNSQPANQVAVDLSANGNAGGLLNLNNSDGANRARLGGLNNGGFLFLYGTDGNIKVSLHANSGGEGKVTTQVLEITGGADLSEQFDIHADRDEIKPGTVVCIDPAEAGRLLPSRAAYDRTVAGVVSGAGGVKPGVLMGQQGTPADGRHPVALTGRVYCRADAAYGSIQPGDLLTTSDTPGHAMRVTDHARAQGAILGKAMERLARGQGLVLVLVTLQ